MKNYKSIFKFLLLLLCFSCKNSNLDGGNNTIGGSSSNSTVPPPEEQYIPPPPSKEIEMEDEMTEENIERCSECNTELITPSNRACYICNGSFSGWGFVKRRGEVDTEQGEKLLINCFPEIHIHNSVNWEIYEDACCSRRCAMDL